MKKKLFITLFKLITGFVSIIVVALVLAIIFRVTVDLSFLKPGIENATKSALGREVKIDGPVVFEFSNWTAVDVRDIQMENVSNATEPDFFTAGVARLQIGLMPLFRGKIHISEIIAEDVILNLQNDANGIENWIFGEPKDPAEKDIKKGMIHFRGLDKLSLKRITLNYHDLALQKSFHAKIDSMSGEISKGEPIIIDMNGHINKTPFNMNIKGLPYTQFMEKTKPWTFKLNGEIGGRKIVSKGDFMYRDAPEVNLAFNIKDVDIGPIFSTLGFVEDISASFGSVDLKVSLKGKGLKQVLSESSMFLAVKDGQWNLNLPKSKNNFDISRINGKISVEKDSNLTIDLSGNIKDKLLKLKITGSPLVDYIDKQNEFPFTIDAEHANMKLHVDTRMQVTDKKYNFSKLDIKVGKSTLNGTMTLDVTQKKPVLDIALVSDTIQVNDFLFKDKSTKKDLKEKKMPKMTQKKKEKIIHLLSEEVLSLITATVKIEAKQILSGKDKLGSALAMVSLKNSRLSVEPLHVYIPGGALNVDLSFLPRNDKVSIDLKAKIDKFDIGVIARRTKPSTDMGGDLYLDAEIHSVTPDLKQMLKDAKGHFDFAIMPKKFSTEIVDKWTSNLLTAIIEKRTHKDQSKVNCFIMRFGLKNGIMQDKIVYMDTTKMLVSGEAKVNFKDEMIEVLLVPKAKKPEFISLATPIKINGTFKDFSWNISIGHLVTSMITSSITFPIKHIAVEKLPSDGKDACRRAWEYTEYNKIEAEPVSVHDQNLEILEGR